MDLSAFLPLHPDYDYPARVVRVVDGDTLVMDLMLEEAMADLGFSFYERRERFFRLRVRLLGMNAPEKNTPEGKAAKKYMELLVKNVPEEWGFRVKTVKDKADKYGGRYDGYVRRAVDNGDLSALMIEAGRGVKWDGKGKRPV